MLTSFAPTGSELRPTSSPGPEPPIDRRRTPEYEDKRARLSDALKLEVDLVEERILSEGEGAFRRTLSDGTIVDLSSYDEVGIIVTFVATSDGPLFIDFAVSPDR